MMLNNNNNNNTNKIDNNNNNYYSSYSYNTPCGGVLTWTDVPQIYALRDAAAKFLRASNEKMHLKNLVCENPARCLGLRATHVSNLILKQQEPQFLGATNSVEAEESITNSTVIGRRIILDYSRQQVTGEIMELLFDLADVAGFSDRRKALQEGMIYAMPYNNTNKQQSNNDNENDGTRGTSPSASLHQQRPVLHHLLRMPYNEEERDHDDDDDDVVLMNEEEVEFDLIHHEVLPNIYCIRRRVEDFGRRIRSGMLRSITNQTFRNVLCLAPPGRCSGSMLGTQCIYEALKRDFSAQKYGRGRILRFVTSIDPIDFETQTYDLNPAETLVIVIVFGTTRSCTNRSNDTTHDNIDDATSLNEVFHPTNSNDSVVNSNSNNIYDSLQNDIQSYNQHNKNIKNNNQRRLFPSPTGGGGGRTTPGRPSSTSSALPSEEDDAATVSNVKTAYQWLMQNLLHSSNTSSDHPFLKNEDMSLSSSSVALEEREQMIVSKHMVAITTRTQIVQQQQHQQQQKSQQSRLNDDDDDYIRNNNNNNTTSSDPRTNTAEDQHRYYSDTSNTLNHKIDSYYLSSLLGRMEYVFQIDDWISDCFAVWSAVGLLPLTIQYSTTIVDQLLEGAHNMDHHFFIAPLRDNIPVLLGLLGVWNSTFLGYGNKALLPFSQALRKFPAYVAHMDMECNGKHVSVDGEFLLYPSAEVSMGDAQSGPDQFYQLLHQGRVVPTDFIGFMESQQVPSSASTSLSNNYRYNVTTYDNNHNNDSSSIRNNTTNTTLSLLEQKHDHLMSHFFAQPDALAFGKTMTDLVQEGITEELRPHKLTPGNRPSTSLLLTKLDAFGLGQLMALYEHRTTVQGFLWGVNSFDRYGPELGQNVAQQIQKQLHSTRTTGASVQGFNTSTSTLLEEYLKHENTYNLMNNTYGSGDSNNDRKSTGNNSHNTYY